MGYNTLASLELELNGVATSLGPHYTAKKSFCSKNHITKVV